MCLPSFSPQQSSFRTGPKWKPQALQGNLLLWVSGSNVMLIQSAIPGLGLQVNGRHWFASPCDWVPQVKTHNSKLQKANTPWLQNIAACCSPFYFLDLRASRI